MELKGRDSMYLLDTADKEKIAELVDHYRFDGVTTNPTILKKEASEDVFSQLADLQNTIAPNPLYIQVAGKDFAAMREEASTLRKFISREGHPPFVMKIPATKDGFKLMKAGGSVHPFAATAVFTFHQGLMAASMHAESVIVYVDRMQRAKKDPYRLIENLRAHFERAKLHTRILAASLKDASQVEKAILAGCHKVTVNVSLAHELFADENTEQSDERFLSDWEGITNQKR